MSDILVTVSSVAPVALPFSSKSQAFRLSSHSIYPSFKGTLLPKRSLRLSFDGIRDCLITSKRSYGFCPVHANDINAGQWSNESKWIPHDTLVSLNDVFNRLPKPVKEFPWLIALRYFTQTIFGLVVTVVKYMCVPVLAISSLSEMSYCAHERKMSYIPIPFLAGVAVARILKQTATDVSPDILDWEYPWHLLLMALFFVLLKLPGPYYPYLGRLIVPHFANGGLWSILWFIFHWFRGSKK